MRRLTVTAIGSIGLCLLAGCSSDDLVHTFTTPEDEARASGFIQNLRDGRIDLIEASLDPELKKPGIGDTLRSMSAAIPKGTPDSVKLVGVQTGIDNGVRSSNLTYQYQFGDRWMLINCATRIVDGQARIVGMNLNSLAESVETTNRFTLSGKPLQNYLLLVAMVLAAGTSLYALVRCVKHVGLRRKWAWVLFILLGVVTFDLNWTTGEWQLKPLSLLLFSAGASASPYGPWELSVALPLGALVYLIRRARNQNAPAQSNPEPIS